MDVIKKAAFAKEVTMHTRLPSIRCLVFVLMAIQGGLFMGDGAMSAEAPHLGPIIRLAPCQKAPAIDGQRQPGHWEGALALSGLTLSGTGVQELREGTLYFTYDAESLYFGMRTEMPPEGHLFYEKGRPAAEYEGKFDSSEIWVVPPGGKPVQFWLEPAGGVFCFDEKVDAKAVTAISRVARDWWILEATIPWKALGYDGKRLKPGTEFHVRPTRNWRYPGDWGPIYSSWGGAGHFKNPASMIKVIVDPDAPTIELNRVGALRYGTLALSLIVTSQAATETEYETVVTLSKIDGEQTNWYYAAWAAKKHAESDDFKKYLADYGLTRKVEKEFRRRARLGSGLSLIVNAAHTFTMPPPKDRENWSYPNARLYDLSIIVKRVGDGAVCFRRTFNVERPRLLKWSFVRPPLQNVKADGYRGLWYQCNGPSAKSKTQPWYYRDYSGGLGTYTAKHRSLAVYSPEANKTFFCYGGCQKDDTTALVHMIGCYDHKTGLVSKPTYLLDRMTHDGHDNVVISRDDNRYIWAFSTSHGLARRAVISRSKRPDDVSEFVMVDAVICDELAVRPLYNFSYAQPWFVPGRGFYMGCTRYIKSKQTGNYVRHPGYMTSADGVVWTPFRVVADFGYGHYNFHYTDERKAAYVCSVMPDKKTNMTRTNIYYIESRDFGRTWRTADGTPVTLPLLKVKNAALVYDYQAEGLRIYIKDIRFDVDGNPVILHIATRTLENGPVDGERMWRIARWDGRQWQLSTITTSDQNFDMGSIYLEDDARWLVLGPTETGPQAYNTGGEVALWKSTDHGATWSKMKDFTKGSKYNHTYVRRPANPGPGFFAFWADGNPRARKEKQPDGRKVLVGGESRLYFATRNGTVFMLPPAMDKDWEKPIPYPLGCGK
jgi:hypothetical protein